MKQKAQQNALIAATADAMLLVDADQRIVLFNPAAERMFGVPANEVAGQPLSRLIPESKNHIELADQTGDPLEAHVPASSNPIFEMIGLRASGQQFFVEASISRVLVDGDHMSILTLRDISERKRAEEQKARSEERLKPLIASIPVAIAMFDRQMRYLELNERWRKACGAPGQVVGACLYDVLPGIRPSWRTAHERAFSGLIQREEEDSYTQPDGTVVWFKWEVRPWHMASGEVGGLVVLLEDITSRKTAEDSLRKSQAEGHARRLELEALMETAPAVVWIAHDPECRNITGNKTAQEILRVPSGRNVSKTAPGEERPQHFAVYQDGSLLADEDLPMQRAARTGKPVLRQELEIRFDDDSSCWIYGNAVPLFNPDASVRGAVATFVDVTPRIKAEHALRESEVRERLRRAEVEALLQAIPAPVWIAHDAGCLHMTGNAAARELIGAHDGQNLSRSAPDTDRPSFEVRRGGLPISPEQLPMQRAVRSRQPVTGDELEIIRPNGVVRWIYGNAIPLFGPEKQVRGCIGVMVDISQIKQAEEERRDFSRRLQAAREAERTKLAREIHDVLAQELTRIKLEIAWVQRRLAKPTDETFPVQLKTKLAEMSQLTDSAILCVQKIATELRPVVLDTHGLIAAIEWQAKDFTARTGIECETSLPPEQSAIDRDCSTTLFRILQECFTNVARHSEASGVNVALIVNSKEITLEFCDNGRGITPERLVDPLSLGLIGMRERAALLSGHCIIGQAPGSGTLVRASIPRSPPHL